MAFDWQNLVALSVVFAAATYIVRCAWRQFATRKPTSGCGACGSCPSSKTAAQELVPLDVHRRNTQ